MSRKRPTRPFSAGKRRTDNSSPKEILDSIEREVELFVGDEPQFDDLTMMCVHNIGKNKQNAEAFNGQEMTVEATLANIPAVTDFVDAQLEALGCPQKVVMQINIAIDELFGNIAHYAYDPETGPATVRVEVEDEPMTVLITFIDHGKPYDPLAAADPDTTLSAEARKIGGLGVFLVKRTMDDISYEYKNGQNILHIRKRIHDK